MSVQGSPFNGNGGFFPQSRLVICGMVMLSDLWLASCSLWTEIEKYICRESFCKFLDLQLEGIQRLFAPVMAIIHNCVLIFFLTAMVIHFSLIVSDLCVSKCNKDEKIVLIRDQPVQYIQ
ncbi:hypothetical protein K1719_026719 [Acacia pycnantha]|nr:hypothetical protein K1719_026719 [Acacia pycnantha]